MADADVKEGPPVGAGFKDYAAKKGLDASRLEQSLASIKKRESEPKEFSLLEEEKRQAEENKEWAEKVLAENRAKQAAKVAATETQPVKIPSQEVAPAAAPWIKREQTRMVQGTQGAAVRQIGAEPVAKPPLPTREQVAVRQSVAQGQEIKKRWYDRIPFLKILRGERQPAG